mmetsp:Transcript_13513/g.20376  ORF Transcript_13513/g.20376 Transcript_13513/m.20376 type:complete len:355 (+) Transcript_13513:118-1182(+)
MAGVRLDQTTSSKTQSSSKDQMNQLTELQNKDAFFLSMVELIPPRYYFSGDSNPLTQKLYAKQEKELLVSDVPPPSKYMKHTPTGKNAQKLRVKLERRKANISSDQTKQEQKEQTDQIVSDDSIHSDDSIDSDDEQSKTTSVPSTKAPDLSNLRERLQNRIQHFRAIRKADAQKPKIQNEEKPRKRKRTRDERKKSATHTEKKQKTTPKKSDDVELSRFDFSTGQPVPTYLAKRKKPSNQLLLRKAELKKEMLEEAKRSESGQALISQEVWQRSLSKASGQKVKDDPSKIRRTIRRERQKKVKSAKKWKERKDTVAQQQRQKQERRNANIQRKIERKKQKRAGFEGGNKRRKKK